MSDPTSATMISRCKLCLEDREKRRIEAPGWDIDTEEDYLAVLTHVVEEHPTDAPVGALFAAVERESGCDACSERFASPVRIQEHGLTRRAYCERCSAENTLRRLFVQSIAPVEIFEDVPLHAE